MPILDEPMLVDLAGEAAIERGVGYFRDGLVTLSERSNTGFVADARGTARYRLWYREDEGEPQWNCSCPAAADGSFCKHLVAASLIWLDGDGSTPADAPKDDLLSLLRRQPAAQLANWLHEAAMDDPGLARSLRLRLASDPAELKQALAAMLRVRGFLDYRRSLDFGERLHEPLTMLDGLLGRNPQQCFHLAAYAVERLLRIYRNADDSAGTIGEGIFAFATLHARAAEAARPDGLKLARALHGLKRHDDWGLFPLDAYWPVLGERGQADYARRVEREYKSLAQPAERGVTASARDGSEFSVVSRYEELSRVRGDFDALLAVLSRDLSSGYAFERIVAACRDFGHDALALQWAERGLKAHPDRSGMRVLAAEEFQRAGLTDEARRLLWDDFVGHPDGMSWSRLKDSAGENWPALRGEALDVVAGRERRLEDGRHDASLRLTLLMLDEDFDAARQLAAAQAASPDVLVSLARRIRRTHPVDAAGMLRCAADLKLPDANANTYAKLVPLMRDAVSLAPGETTDTWISGIRDRYRARRKLMRLMDEAGLA
ncbi:SWIM zinc finger family protein [Methylonatrum kenyense]|uniref:SWIM zinc finger family protein n=1 Tax=Methylonatrum kenyense TaxID=455253 RepID=UPI00209B9A98|nr:SWIM zinc finger family protein [Methylonatrum kenyense]MCK8515086.1 SWIM zinc finger family protein [Methylonatrum kenyense]